MKIATQNCTGLSDSNFLIFLRGVVAKPLSDSKIFILPLIDSKKFSADTTVLLCKKYKNWQRVALETFLPKRQCVRGNAISLQAVAPQTRSAVGSKAFSIGILLQAKIRDRRSSRWRERYPAGIRMIDGVLENH